MRMVAVFGTRHILTESPVFSGQLPMHVEFIEGREFSWYSTGKLEEALAGNYDVYVVSIRPAFGPQDDWWRALIPPDRIFNARRILFSLLSDDPMEAVFEPWRALYAILGATWPEGEFKDFDDPATWLAANHGVRDGSLFAGHGALVC